MFRRHRRSSNPIFFLFRTLLSLVMFLVLIGGLYSAYKHFSGLDPLKIDPQTLVSSLIKSKSPQDLLTIFTSLKLAQTNDKGSQSIFGQIQIASIPIPTSQPEVKTAKSLAFKFAMIADSHNDNLYLKKALSQIKKDYPSIKFLIGLGDYTEVGILDELKNAKKELDNAGMRYFLIPGDHDLWDSRDKSHPPNFNFNQVFGPTYQSFSEGNFNFILINNSDNYLGVGEEQMKWISDQLEKGKGGVGTYVFAHEPLFHPSSDHVMGRIEASLKPQAKNITNLLKDGEVKKVFFGDIHYFSEYSEPETGLAMVTIGAITSERNTQAPRFGIGKVYDNGEIEVEDVEIK